MNGKIYGRNRPWFVPMHSFDSSVDGLRKIMGYFSRNKFKNVYGMNFSTKSLKYISNAIKIHTIMFHNKIILLSIQ
jgi:hypothetical protein